jgi:bacteriophage CI repressor helix-turn-helix domain
MRDIKMSISNRLREVMEYKGLNIKVFAELLEIPYRTLQNYLLNKRDPRADVLIKVSEMLNVDLNWLMLGEGKMFRRSVGESDLTEKEKVLIDYYRMMSNDTKIAFDVSFKFLSGK